MNMKSEELWVFAYGSLCWRPGFEYDEMLVGHVKGYARRFWQGNTYHRGTVDKPGRVATLISDAHAETYGCAFKVTESHTRRTLKYLETRETKRGGYDTRVSMFYPCDSSFSPVKVVLYIALPGNVDWKGPGKLQDVAEEVLQASGACGSNIDYVTDLAAFLRQNNFKDEHVFELERIVLEKLKAIDDSSSSDFDSDSI